MKLDYIITEKVLSNFNQKKIKEGFYESFICWNIVGRKARNFCSKEYC